MELLALLTIATAAAADADLPDVFILGLRLSLARRSALRRSQLARKHSIATALCLFRCVRELPRYLLCVINF